MTLTPRPLILAAALALTLTTRAGGDDGHAHAPVAHETPAAVTPDAALQQLKDGNARYATGGSLFPHLDGERRCATSRDGQTPFAAILACADSRVPTELVFDQGVGDLFVVRVAGNVAAATEAGTLEYGVAHLRIPLVVVMGHAKCGAVATAVSGAQLHGNLATLIGYVRPAAEQARAAAHPNAPQANLVAAAIDLNVRQSMRDLLANSPELRAAVAAGKCRIVGAVYDLHSGGVRWIGEHPEQARLLIAPPDLAHAAPPKPKHDDHPADAHVATAHHNDGHGHAPTYAPAVTPKLMQPKHDSHHGHESKPHKDEHATVPHASAAPPTTSARDRGGLLVPAAFLAGGATLSGTVVYLVKARPAAPTHA